MGLEIERKFLVIGDAYRNLSVPVLLRQAYLSSHPDRVVRIRSEGEKAFITIKSKTIGISRGEWEYPIPMNDAAHLLDCVCEQPAIEKNRYRIKIDEVVWEVDEFFCENAGLVVAEIELSTENQAFVKPDWVGEEVTHDHRYANANLFKHPFLSW
jgi:adenylate cyclase